MKVKKKVTFNTSLIILLSLIGFMVIGMIIFNAPTALMFILSWLILTLIGLIYGYTIDELENAAFNMGRKAFMPIVMIWGVGALVGTFIAAGVVPALIYGGLIIIDPKFFLVTTLLLCSIVSVATGSSYGSMGTAGLAMMAVGSSLGVPVGITAGAVISGAFFGDKMSPLSDTTNMAAAVTRVPLMTHVKHMMFTTGPAYIITAILFLVIGFKYSNGMINDNQINEILTTLDASFKISFVELIPVVFLVVLLMLKVPVILSLFGSALFGAIFAVIRQGASISDVLKYMWSGVTINTQMDFVDNLVNRGGILSMNNTVLVILFAFFLVGVIQKLGIVEALTAPLTAKINSRAKLTANSLGLSYLVSAIGCSSTLAIVMTSALMSPIYKEFNLHPKNLSRVIEESATLAAPLIPWHSNAIFTAGMLGVSPLQYIPYCFLNWISPLISLIYGITGFTMTKLGPEDSYILEDEDETKNINIM